jgi:hypothetical protein
LLLGLKLGRLCDVIIVVTEFMVDVAWIEAWPPGSSNSMHLGRPLSCRCYQNLPFIQQRVTGFTVSPLQSHFLAGVTKTHVGMLNVEGSTDRLSLTDPNPNPKP